MLADRLYCGALTMPKLRNSLELFFQGKPFGISIQIDFPGSQEKQFKLGEANNCTIKHRLDFINT